jgi:hypothetical protein
MRYLLMMLLMVVSASPTAAQAKKIATTEDLVVAMQKKYARSWYRTATFVQRTTEFAEDGTAKVSTWYEALSVPGKLRIDFTPVKDGNGLLFTNSTIYSFKDGKVENTRPFVHPLLILGFDIYKMPPAAVVDTLKKLKFDLSRFREDTWQGRPVYVVGANAGDLHSPQFWIDQKNLYFVRMLRPAGKDGKQTSETQFNKYQKLGGGWISPEVIFLIDGRIATTEAYSEMRANVSLDSKLFDPQFWSTVHWRQ